MAATVNPLMAISPAAETPVSLSASQASSQPSNYNDEISDSRLCPVNPDCSTLLSATKPEPSTTVSKPASMGEALPVQVMPLSPLPDSLNAVAGLNAKLSSLSFALAPPGLVLESQQSRIQLQSSLAATHITASSSQPAAVVAGMAVAAQNAFLLLLDAFGAGTVKPELLHAASLNASNLDHLETTNVQLDTKTHRVIMDGIDVVARSKNILSKTLLKRWVGLIEH
ncbi:hypothetical protein BSLG_006048 [Batrachochytrium salamandrivorans]|nr:hypothetical protein BSLG_006048 [Batrachochytrium salamandrivorans]